MAGVPITYSWVRQVENAGRLSDFFVQNVSPNYISHGEILTGRALDGKTWAVNLREIMLKELINCVESFRQGGVLRAAVATQNGKILGLAIVQLVRDTPNPHAWINDLIVDHEVRSRGVGSGILEWIENELRSQQVLWVFLESGIENKDAHHFFESRGYSTCSLVMRKILHLQ